jgi:poly-gamma-glutamate synthase PgsB/CapB
VTVLLFFLAGWVGYLAVEALRLRRWRETIPLRITVTGTRGKSSVVRMLAAVLREDGWTVLAKSTGAEATLIMPDGSERRIRRRGNASILEQIGVVGLGARLGVDALVVEVMSLHPENHLVESRRILRPHMVLATNFRVDHVEAHGKGRDQVARVLALDVPRRARVVVLEDEGEEVFSELAREEGAALRTVSTRERGGRGGRGALGANSDLVRAAAEMLEVEEEAAERGLRNVRQDLGAFRCWRYPGLRGGGDWAVVNAFAANDPESTLRSLDGLPLTEGLAEKEEVRRPAGLLTLRRDRADRSLLWTEALIAGALSRFGHLYVHGFHANAVSRRLRGFGGPEVEVLGPTRPEEIMKRVMGAEVGKPAAGRGRGGGEQGVRVLVGFGNMGGLGERMVRHWSERGEPLTLEEAWEWVVHRDDRPTSEPGRQGGVHGI